MASPPKVRALLLCDGVVQDPTTGKTTLVGVFERVFAAEFPSAQPDFTVYVRLTGLNGSYRLEIDVLAADLQTRLARIELLDVLASDDPAGHLRAVGRRERSRLAGSGPLRAAAALQWRIADDSTLTVEDDS